MNNLAQSIDTSKNGLLSCQLRLNQTTSEIYHRELMLEEMLATLEKMEQNFCFQKNLSDPTQCSGHGKCERVDYCVCRGGWSGQECQDVECFGQMLPEEQCSQHGQCVDVDNCTCLFFWSGDECEEAWTEWQPVEEASDGGVGFGGEDVRPVARRGHTMVPFGSNVWMFGGSAEEEDVNELWKYDLSLSAWEETTPSEKPPARRLHSSVLHPNGFMLIFGGWPDLDDLWKFQFVNSAWEEVSKLSTWPDGRHSHTSAMVHHGMVVFGGYDSTDNQDFNDIWMIHQSHFIWQQLNPENDGPNPRSEHCASIVDNVIYIFGGRNEAILNELWKLDVTQTWHLIPFAESWPSPRTYATMLPYKNGLWMFGGSDGAEFYNDLWRFDLLANEWVVFEENPRPLERTEHASFIYDGFLWISGGFQEETPQLEDLWKIKMD